MHKLDAVKRKVASSAVVLGVTLFSVLIGLMLNNALVQTRNETQLKELSSQLLARTELAADYAIITLGDLLAAGAASCDDNALRLMRNSIARRGAIKNIAVSDRFANVRCSGLPFDREITKEGRAANFQSANRDIFLQTASANPDGIFKVVWNVSQSDRFVAVLNIDMLMFDVFPPDIREHSQAMILLGGKAEVASYRPEKPAGNLAQLKLFESASTRFPITVRLYVEPADIASWNDHSRSIAVAIAAALGMAVAFLVNKLLWRPPSELDSLRQAIRRGEIQPYFQPIFSLADMRIVGCEVLMRWVRGGVFVAPPDRFIPLAENSDLIVQMTNIILSDALRKMKRVLDNSPDFKIAFNVTPAHFTSRDFLQTLCDRVEGQDVSRSHIVIELTERQAFVDTTRATSAAIAVREAGFRISLDDTGSGHNGLGYVQELPVDIIKIDKKFIDLVHLDQAASSIVKMLVRLAQDLGMSTVAEGIENEKQLDALRQCGVSEGQGYIVSPAVPIDRFLMLLENETIGSPLELVA